MPEVRAHKAPRFLALTTSRVIDNKSVELLFLAEDGERYALEFSPEVIGPTIDALAGFKKKAQ